MGVKLSSVVGKGRRIQQAMVIAAARYMAVVVATRQSVVFGRPVRATPLQAGRHACRRSNHLRPLGPGGRWSGPKHGLTVQLITLLWHLGWDMARSLFAVYAYEKSTHPCCLILCQKSMLLTGIIPVCHSPR